MKVEAIVRPESLQTIIDRLTLLFTYKIDILQKSKSLNFSLLQEI